MSEAPASPAVSFRVPLRSPSPWLNMDTLSSDESGCLGDVSVHPICILDVSNHSGDLDQALSEDDLPPEVRVVDLPPEARSDNLSPEVRMNDLSPEVRLNDLQPEVRVVELPPEVRIIYLTPEDCVVDLPPEGRVDAVSTAASPGSERMSPCSPPVVSLDQSVVSSMVISPNRVRLDASLDTPDEEAVSEVSPDTSGILMRPSGAVLQPPLNCLPVQPDPESCCEPLLGDPVDFTLSGPIPGSDAPPMIFPVYPLPSGLTLLSWQSSVQTVLATAFSSRPDVLSTGVPRTYDVSREGPFDAYGSPMDTGDSPLVATGLLGCPYRIMSYTGPAVADSNPAFGMQLHHPRFLEYVGAPESARLLYRSPAFWVQRLGEEDAVAAAINLQRDAGVMLSNLHIPSQFVTSLHWLSSEMLNLGMGGVVFPSQEVEALSPMPRAPRAAQ